MLLSYVEFNWAALPEHQRTELRERMHRMQMRRQRMVRDVIEEGFDLIQIKAMLPRGQFKTWLDAEYHSSHRTADHFMRIARAFEAQFLQNRNCFDGLAIDQRALIVLAEPACPEAARQEALAIAQERRVDEKIARNIVRLYSDRSEPISLPGSPKPQRQQHSAFSPELLVSEVEILTQRLELLEELARDVIAAHRVGYPSIEKAIAELEKIM